ncbi:hypothetical protein K461DRAFT_288985 [Myriangium duriaei CBS 260.36]|uniref:DUF4604 domain-containing protein n=1 Tax=Myriangium duriaei CBS 260.36 TaxID=1168546 RepID=A0A9P4JBH3_9PEZI|nr:hypothetical protein K461DRAFT_288985 [Myriangium duriaei CBS 260.36]
MSSKPKGLEYKANEPAFLQRMRAQNTGADGRHERPVPRPRRGKVDDNDDDAPAYVMEDTNDNLTKKEYDKLVADEKAATADSGDEEGNVKGKVQADGPFMSGALPTKDTASAGSEEVERPSTGKVSEAKLGQKKRKAAAVVGQDHADEDDGEVEGKAKAKKTKKKGKPIKLSFDEND